ncbi:MAG: hypothetical protein V7L11_03100 [Nostoc sp.]|uniref:hypothetical protein n=1 Tax=Nostoc sp. TaxID=1180 RepID=UPI002FF5982C
MVKILSQGQAFGSPGIDPRWTHANKDGVGTAYSTSSNIWFTIWNGVVYQNDAAGNLFINKPHTF